MTRPRVAVIVPCYNHAAFLAEAIDSALRQTLPVHEIVVVDDGSTDGTREVLARYGDRIRFFPREHQGIAASYNFGLDQTTSAWVAFLESDDALEPTYLEEIFEFIDVHPELAWVSTARLVVDDTGRPTGDLHRKPSSGPYFTTRSFLERDLGCASTPVARRDALLAVGPFDGRSYGADTDMALRFSLSFPMACLDRPLYRYRRHGANTSWDPTRNLREALAILERFCDEHPDFVRANAAVVRRSLARYSSMLAAAVMESDPEIAPADVLPLLARAARLDPLRLKYHRRLLAVRLFGTRSFGGRRRRRRTR